MIDNEVIEAFNARPKVDLNNIKKMTPAQLDKVKTYGSQAENLLTNKDFVQFIHHYKFEVSDAIGGVGGYTEEDNQKRIALSNHLAGIDSFIATLQRAVYYKNKVVSQQQAALDPNLN